MPRARRADGTRVHLLGAAEHGGRLLDQLDVGVKHNETSHFTELLGSVDLAGAVVTFDALHTVRANLNWLVKDKNGHRDQPDGSGPANLAAIRAAVITARKDAGYLHVPEGRRDHTTPAETLRLHGLD